MKSKRLCLALATFVLLAIATTVLWPKPPPQIITLPNGDQYEFAGVTYGTNLVPPSLLCQIANHLPARLHGLALKVFGKSLKWETIWPTPVQSTTYRNDPPLLTVWFRQAGTNSHPPRASILAGISLADQNDFVVEQGRYQSHPRLFASQIWNDITGSNGWFGQVFTLAPKRSPVLRVLLEEGKSPESVQIWPPREYSNFVRRIDIPNRLQAIVPQWQPKTSLPATSNFPDLHVAVGPVNFGDRLMNRTATDPQPQAGVTVSMPANQDWIIKDAELSDATGNVLHDQYPSYHAGGFRDTQNISFSGALWPGENAWRLRIQFTNSVGAGHTVELYAKPPY